MHRNLSHYCYLFENLHRDKKNGGAPHKPILLISLIQAYQQKLFNTNQITIIPDLVGLFKSNWKNLVTTNHTCLFTLPFYFMNSEPFWNLVPNPGCEIWLKSKSAMRSFESLTTAIKYVSIDQELADLLKNKQDSDILLQILLNKYFIETKEYSSSHGNSYISDITHQIFEENQESYRKRLIKIREELDSEEFKEEVYIRSNVFKREVPKIYNYTCCISRLRIDITENVSMIDACHIIPFSESYNDTISNGIALCPTLHRAFDRGLISINSQYRVIVNNRIFSEPHESKYSIKQFSGERILLPESQVYYPSTDSLNYHNKKFNIE